MDSQSDAVIIQVLKSWCERERLDVSVRGTQKAWVENVLHPQIAASGLVPVPSVAYLFAFLSRCFGVSVTRVRILPRVLLSALSFQDRMLVFHHANCVIHERSDLAPDGIEHRRMFERSDGSLRAETSVEDLKKYPLCVVSSRILASIRFCDQLDSGQDVVLVPLIPEWRLVSRKSRAVAKSSSATVAGCIQKALVRHRAYGRSLEEGAIRITIPVRSALEYLASYARARSVDFRTSVCLDQGSVQSESSEDNEIVPRSQEFAAQSTASQVAIAEIEAAAASFLSQSQTNIPAASQDSGPFHSQPSSQSYLD